MPKRHVTEGPSPEALRQQLQRAIETNNIHESEIRALRAELGRPPNRLLVELAAALHLAAHVSDPQQAHNYDPSGIRQSTEPPLPGASTAAQRRSANHFKQQLHRALNEFEAARRRNWQSTDRIPSVRCVNRECSQVNKRVRAWDHRGPNEFCVSCGHRLRAAETIKMTADSS